MQSNTTISIRARLVRVAVVSALVASALPIAQAQVSAATNAAQHTDSNSKGGSASQQSNVDVGEPMSDSMLVLMPTEQASADRLGKGCWVRFYREKNFQGRNLTLVGPLDMPKIRVPGGAWIDWSSAVVGPNAIVDTYDYEQFKSRSAKLQPGQRIPDLGDKKLGLFEDIHSARVNCRK